MDITGVWIGTTLGVESRTHHWIIVQEGASLDIYTRWADETSYENQGKFQAVMGTNNLFRIFVPGGESYGEVLNDDSFKVHQWVFSWKDGKWQPLYDVLFQRSTEKLQHFEAEFILKLYQNHDVVKRLSNLPYA